MRKVLIVAGAVALALLVLRFIAGPLKSPLNDYDEGLVLLNASRVMQGDVPYRDFWTVYAPGQLYVLAALFRLFGENVLTARVLDSLVRLGIAAETLYLARRLAPWRLAWLPCALAILWLAAIRFYSYGAFPALALGLLAIIAFARWAGGDAGQSRWLALAGLAGGITATVRLDFGAYVCVALAAATALRVLGGPEAARGGRSRLQSVARAEGLLGGMALLAALPLYAYLSLAAGFTTWWSDLVIFPATVLGEMRRIPVPPLVPADANWVFNAQGERWLRYYLPLAMFAWAVLAALRMVLVRGKPTADYPAGTSSLLVALALFGTLLFNQASNRYDEIHVLPATVLAMILAAGLLARVPWRGRYARYWAAPLAIICAGLLLQPYVLRFSQLYAQGTRLARSGCFSGVPAAGCVAHTREGQQWAVETVRARTQPGDYIFVGNSRHDSIFVNDLSVYFLAQRRCPTRYCELHPGLATTLPVQQEIAAGIAEHDVQWLVMVYIPPSREPNGSALSSGVTYLDEYIRANFRAVERQGIYELWERTGSQDVVYSAGWH